MKRWMAVAVAVAGALTPALSAQQYQRRATIVGGGDRDHGKCTIEVVVDGAADVEIRGDQGIIRNLSGQPAQWRRFECTAAMPPNAANFHFAGVDGRGRQQLNQEPRNGGPAVIRIEDPKGGSEGYTFDLTWGGNNNTSGYDQPGYNQPRYNQPGYNQPGYNQPGYNQPGYNQPGYSQPGATVQGLPGDNRYPANQPDDRDYGNRGPDQRYPRNPDQFRNFSAQQAVNVCQNSVRQQARTRFRGRTVQFRDVQMDDQPGRNDWVTGRVDVLARGNAAEQGFQFSCSVNFDNGQVRSVQLDPLGAGYRQGSSDRQAAQRALDSCQQAVRTRVLRNGDARVEFTSVRLDDNPGRNDWVIGTVQTDDGRGFESFNFSCSVDLRDGDVRSLDLTRRDRQ